MSNNFSSIPFYKTKEEQDFRLWYAYGERYPLLVPNDYLIPFFINLPKGQYTNNYGVEFYRACGSEEQVLGSGAYNMAFSLDFSQYTNNDGVAPETLGRRLKDNGLVIETIQGHSCLVYYADTIDKLNLERGFYYLRIYIDTLTYYSDVFFVETTENLKRKILVEWNTEDMLHIKDGIIPFGDNNAFSPFRNMVYVDSTIGTPEYKFTEDGEERNGHFFPIKQISEKVYKFSFIAPEYLCDALRTIRMADYINVRDELGRTYDVEQFETEIRWLDGGHYAEVACSFQTDTIVKKIGKSY